MRSTYLVDVRSTPYSRFHPQFNKNALQQALLAHGIAYTWAGEALGGRPKDPACYKHHAIPSKAGDYLHEVRLSRSDAAPLVRRGHPAAA